MKTVTHWIGGKPFGDASGASGTWAPVTDPATGEVTAHVAMAGPDEAASAVAAAKEAYATWRTSPLTHRIAILFRYRALLDARRDDIAALITAEQGKVHADALAEVARGVEIVELACGLGMALKGDTSTEVSSGVDVASVRQPLGVFVGISPFNFPAMISRSAAPSQITVAAACTPGKLPRRVTAALATMPVPITAANQLGPSSGRVVLFAVGSRVPVRRERFISQTYVEVGQHGRSCPDVSGSWHLSREPGHPPEAMGRSEH